MSGELLAGFTFGVSQLARERLHHWVLRRSRGTEQRSVPREGQAPGAPRAGGEGAGEGERKEERVRGRARDPGAGAAACPVPSCGLPLDPSSQAEPPPAHPRIRRRGPRTPATPAALAPPQPLPGCRGDAPGPRHARAIVSRRRLAGTPPCLCRVPSPLWQGGGSPGPASRDALHRSACFFRPTRATPRPTPRTGGPRGGLQLGSVSARPRDAADLMAHTLVFSCAALPGKLTSGCQPPQRDALVPSGRGSAVGGQPSGAASAFRFPRAPDAGESTGKRRM
ncbi:uncharacterized protein LOC144366128 [Ictidomys tridecemlineatus]